MASTGQVAPTTATTVAEAPWSDNDWTSAGNVTADDGTTASVTAASFDSGDRTFVLKAAGFDFSSIPAGSTINGVTVRVNAFFRSGQGSGSLDLCQLLNTSGAKVGTNQCSTPVALSTTTSTVITKGSSSDLWGNALTRAWVQDPDFGVALGILATAANADVDIDSVTMEIEYTAPTGQFVDITAATETDTPGHLQQVHTPAATAETSSAQPLSFVKPIHKALGVVAEADTAQALDYAVESSATNVDILPAAETDAAQALDADKQVALSPASGTDTAQPLTFAQASDFTVTPTAEADTAQALDYVKPIHLTLGVASESDTALPLVQGGGPVPITPTSESDAAQALDVVKPIHKTLGVVTETDTPGHLQQVHSVGPVAETDAAQTLSVESGAGSVTIGPAAETDTAQALSITHTGTTQVDILPAGQIVGPPPFFEFLPSDVAQALTVVKQATLGTVTESDTAQPVTAAGNHAILPAPETDVAQSLDFAKPIHKTLGVVTEADTAQPVTVVGKHAVSAATETDVALALTVTKAASLAPIAAADTAQPLDFAKPIHRALGPAGETDTARAASVTHVHHRTILGAAEADVAQVLAFTLGTPPPATIGLTVAEGHRHIRLREQGAGLTEATHIVVREQR